MWFTPPFVVVTVVVEVWLCWPDRKKVNLS